MTTFLFSCCRHRSLLSLLLVSAAMVFFACSGNDDEKERYPALITEFTMAYADSEGLLNHFITDAGHTYFAANEVKGMDANEVARVLIGYTVEDDNGSQTSPRAWIYTAKAIPVLTDYIGKESPSHDPTGVESVWRGGRYINCHLRPKTQGGKQSWAYLTDSVSKNAFGGNTYHLSLFHRQMDDQQAYSGDLYLSIPLDSIAAFNPSDSLSFTIVTYTGLLTWRFNSLN
jgi:hypothetical protein